jgi:hypothetical protein
MKPIDYEVNKLYDTYNRIKESINYHKYDSFDVVKAVVNHRNFWKPPIVKTILLAESHVYTTDEDLSNSLSYPSREEFKDLPTEFLRLVYCLGYGEQKYLAPGIGDRKGTPQFWKIFAACAADTPDLIDHEQNKILKGPCPSFIERSLNKVKLLKILANKGIWLLDSSIVGLYQSGIKPPFYIRNEIISICWDNYISEIIKSTNPTFIIVIGREVASFLKSKLENIQIRYEVIYQPNAILAKSKRDFKKEYFILNNICNGEYITSNDLICKSITAKERIMKEERSSYMESGDGIDIDDRVETTRGFWKAGIRRENAEYAFALFHGIIKEVYTIKKWYRAGSLEYEYRDASEYVNKGRWEFDGEISPEEIRSKYIGKSVQHLIKKGSQNPIKYVNC